MLQETPLGKHLRCKKLVWVKMSCCCCCCYVASVVSDSVRPQRRKPTRLPRPWDSPGKNTGVACHFLLQWMKVKSEREVSQSCPTLSDPMDYSLPGSSIHGIFQARVLEWAAIAFSERWASQLASAFPLWLYSGIPGNLKNGNAPAPAPRDSYSFSLGCGLSISIFLKAPRWF